MKKFARMIVDIFLHLFEKKKKIPNICIIFYVVFLLLFDLSVHPASQPIIPNSLYGLTHCFHSEYGMFRLSVATCAMHSVGAE